MTEASGAGGLPAGLSIQRRRRAVYSRRYSRFVSLSKWLFPALAVGLLLLIVWWPRIQSTLEKVRFQVPHLDLTEARELRMVQARYTGIDRQNRPFVLTAEVAHQAPKDDGLVSLDAPKGDITEADGTWTELTAWTGVYQPDAQLLDLFGKVDIYQDKGNEFHTDSIHIDLATNSAEGHDPVEGHGPLGQINAEGIRILDRGDTIIFTGHAVLKLLPRNKDTQ
jgi:lipopolysaccharide export system protein LptC